jgi:hypothetical protein
MANSEVAGDAKSLNLEIEHELIVGLLNLRRSNDFLK